MTSTEHNTGAETMTTATTTTGALDMNENVELTASCYYEGQPVAATTIMAAIGCTVDDVARAVKAGLLRGSIRRVGPAGSFLRGAAALHVVPVWA